MRISYSALETFTTCPAKYKFQYIDRISAPKSKEAVFGTIIHECLKKFHDPANGHPLLEEDLLKCFTDKWDCSVYLDQQEEAFAFAQGIDLLKRYYLQNQGKNFNIVSLETAIEIPIQDDKNFHQVTGKIDRIDKLDDGSFEVIDYKTSKKMPAQKFVDDNLQLAVYHLGLLHRWPSLSQAQKPVKLTLYFLKHGETLSAIKKNPQTSETKEKILDSIRQISQSNFEPRPNPLCDWCSYQPYCPLFKHKFIKEQSIDDKEISEVIAEYFSIRNNQGKDTKRLIELKAKINRYLDQKELDRVFGQAGQITRLLQQRFSYDMVKVREILEPLGKWHNILTVDVKKFKKAIDSLPYDLKKKIDQAKTLNREFKIIYASRKK